MAYRIHALMKNANDGDAVAGWSEVDDMLLGAAPPVARPDVAAALCALRRFSQIGARSFDKIGVAHCLEEIPACSGGIKYRIEVALRSRTKPVFSQTDRLYAA